MTKIRSLNKFSLIALLALFCATSVAHAAPARPAEPGFIDSVENFSSELVCETSDGSFQSPFNIDKRGQNAPLDPADWGLYPPHYGHVTPPLARPSVGRHVLLCCVRVQSFGLTTVRDCLFQTIEGLENTPEA